MTFDNPSMKTAGFVLAFTLLYMTHLLRASLRNLLDLYDFILLSLVVTLPLFFILLPGPANAISQLIGVVYPLTILFGLLFIATFVFLHRLVVDKKRNEKSMTSMVQELALIKLELLTLQRQMPQVHCESPQAKEKPVT